MKIKCISNYKLNESQAGILQIFYNNQLKAKYSRLREYRGVDQQTHKPIFEYTKVSITEELQTQKKEMRSDVVPCTSAHPCF